MTNRESTWAEAVESLKRQTDKAELVKACYYDDPLLDAAKRFHASSEWRALRKLLPPTGSVLDIGSGRGISAFAFASDGWTVSALEPDPSLVVGAGAIRSLAADGGVAINVFESWGEQLPFPDESFDVVHCRAVMHHAGDLNAFMKEVERVLKPGGTFFGTREHVISNRKDLPTFLDRHPLHHLYGGESAYLLSEYKQAISMAGLSLIKSLNPCQSDVNLAPETVDGIKSRWAKKIGLPHFSKRIPDAIVTLRGAMMRTPGRLYTFVAQKPA